MYGIPTEIDCSQDWLVQFWSSELGISPPCLRQYVDRYGASVSRIRRELRDGVRIAIEDRIGDEHLVARLTFQSDGVGISVPYHPVQEGAIFEMEVDYNERESVAPITKCYVTNARIKLSVHFSGFVQFSTAGGKPILSGFDMETMKPKGAGLRAPDPILVDSGPLFGITLQGLDLFKSRTNQVSEVFRSQELWHDPNLKDASDEVYCIEGFMFPKEFAHHARTAEGNRILNYPLPLNSRFKFNFDLRLIELPHQPYVLGLIVKHAMIDDSIVSGYKIGGPGCGPPGSRQTMLYAYYPRPDFVDELEPISLDLKQIEEI